MKRIVSIAMLMMAMTVNSQAQGRDSSTTTDSIDIPSLDEIIEMEANLSSKNENERHYKRVWAVFQPFALLLDCFPCEQLLRSVNSCVPGIIPGVPQRKVN